MHANWLPHVPTGQQIWSVGQPWGGQFFTSQVPILPELGSGQRESAATAQPFIRHTSVTRHRTAFMLTVCQSSMVDAWIRVWNWMDAATFYLLSRVRECHPTNDRRGYARTWSHRATQRCFLSRNLQILSKFSNATPVATGLETRTHQRWKRVCNLRRGAMIESRKVCIELSSLDFEQKETSSIPFLSTEKFIPCVIYLVWFPWNLNGNLQMVKNSLSAAHSTTKIPFWT